MLDALGRYESHKAAFASRYETDVESMKGTIPLTRETFRELKAFKEHSLKCPTQDESSLRKSMSMSMKESGAAGECAEKPKSDHDKDVFKVHKLYYTKQVRVPLLHCEGD